MKYIKLLPLIFLSLFLIGAGMPVSALERLPRSPRVLPDELLTRSPRLPRESRTFADSEILVQRRGSDHFERLAVPVGSTVEEMLALYNGRNDVLYAEPNYIAYAQFVPNDSYYNPYQWNFDNSSYGGIHMQDAWDTSTGSDVIIAVIDTGVAYEDYSIYRRAPDLSGTVFVPGYDFVGNDTHPNDNEGHGTHVTGTLAGTTNNSSGVAGVAFHASVMPVKVLNAQGSGTYADIADGIRFAADNGAHVINLSLGGSSSSQVMYDAVKYAYEKGVTIVAAAGNNGVNGVLYPAAYDDYVIAVGATRFDETRAPYSNYGSSLDIVAPGGDVSVDQNGDGYGDGILQQTFGSNVRSFGYYFYQGTSMATPHVAGVAALVIANGNATTPDDVRTALESSADDIGVPGRDNTYGWGLLNARSALLYTEGTPPPPPPSPENQAPVADAGTAVRSLETGVVGTFDGSASYDDVGIVSYDWTFGDGVSTSGDVVGHAYLSAGTYTATLTVEDAEGLSDSDTITVTVTDPVVEPPSDGDVMVFEDSFEVSTWNGLWTEGSQNDWFRSTQRATDGNVSAEVDGRATDAALISVPINLQGRTNATITFDWLIESRLDTNEYLAMDVSFDGGSSWQEKARLRGNVDAEDVWHAKSIEVNNISGLQIRFRGKMSNSSEDANVDNVRVVAF